MDMLSGVEGKDVDRLKAMKPNRWEAIAGKDSYYAKEAINEALNITNLSKQAGENLSARNRIEQIFKHIKDGDNSEYDASDYDIDAIRY